MSQQTKRFYEFDRFRLDVTERVLLCDGAITPLTQKAFEVLLALVERRGGIVSKEELMEKVWPDTFVEESNLAQNIYTLRKALGQGPNGEGYIATVPRRGYRFAAGVREWSESAEPKNEQPLVQSGINSGAQTAMPASSPSSLMNLAAITAPTAPGQPDPMPEPDSSPGPSETIIGAGPHHSRSSGLSSRARKIFFATMVVIVTVGAVGFYFRQNRGDTFSKDMTVTALTTAGNVLTAAISPDGAYVAYATSERSDQNALWIEQLSTSTRRAIVPAAEQRYYALSFSPDGGHVYYVAATNESKKRAAYRVSVLGGPSRLVADDINAAVAFSPDGSKIALRRAVDVRRVMTLTIADPDGKNEMEIASLRYPELLYDPAWSPDGKTIACAAGNPEGVADMYVVGVRAGDWSMKKLSTRRWKWIGQTAWLADSRGLVMVAQEHSAARRQIWLLDVPSGEARRITNDANTYNRLSFSAEDGVIAALQVKQHSNVWLTPAEDPGRARQVTQASGGYRGDLSWTPDNRLVYDSEASASPAISIMEADGSDSKLLTGELAGRAYVGHSVASPDGRFIVFTSDLKGERHIWRMNVDGGAPTQLTNGTGEAFPSCSPDGRWVYYTRLERPGVGLPAIGRVSIDGGEMKLLTEDFTAFPAVSPDGKSFACLWAEGPGPNPWRIAIYSSDGGRPIKIFSHPIQSQPLRWSPDGRGLTYSENPASGASKLWLQPLDGAAPKQLAAFDNDQIFGHDWSRDGKRLACVRGLWTTNVVLIKNFE